VVCGDGVTRLSRLVETVGTSYGNRSRRTDYEYTAKGFLQDKRVRDWVDATQIQSAPLLRWTRYSYLSDQRYVDRGILGLISRVEVYDGTSLLPGGENRLRIRYLCRLRLPAGSRGMFSPRPASAGTCALCYRKTAIKGAVFSRASTNGFDLTSKATRPSLPRS
jgi:hypothetical protein